MSPTPRGWPRGVFSEKLGGGVRPTSQNPYSNYDQTGQNQLNWMLYLWPKRLKDHTLCASHTYMYKTHIREYPSPGHFSFVDIFLILFCFIINALLCYRVFWNCYNFNFVWASRKVLTCLRCTFFVEEVQWTLLIRFDVKQKVTFVITNTVRKAPKICLYLQLWTVTWLNVIVLSTVSILRRDTTNQIMKVTGNLLIHQTCNEKYGKTTSPRISQ